MLLSVHQEDFTCCNNMIGINLGDMQDLEKGVINLIYIDANVSPCCICDTCKKLIDPHPKHCNPDGITDTVATLHCFKDNIANKKNRLYTI